MKWGAERILRRGGGPEEGDRLNRQAIRVLLALELRCSIEYGQNSKVGRHGPYEVESHTLLAFSNLKLLPRVLRHEGRRTQILLFAVL